MSGDENSSVNSEWEDEDQESHISYQSMEEEYQQQQVQIQDDQELFNSSSDDESIESSFNADDAAKRFYNGKKDDEKKQSSEQKEMKKGQEKTIDIVPIAIKNSAVSCFNNDAISKDLFKTCCVNQCCLKISPFHESYNFEPCMQFIRERRKDLFGKSSSEQISLLKTYIYNSMNRKIPAIKSKGGSSNIDFGRMNFDYMVEGQAFCGKGFCHVFGISYYLRKKLVTEIKEGLIGVTNVDLDGKKLTTIDSEAVGNIVKLLNEYKILISNSMRSNLSIPDSAEIGYVRKIHLRIFLFLNFNTCSSHHSLNFLGESMVAESF